MSENGSKEIVYSWDTQRGDEIDVTPSLLRQLFNAHDASDVEIFHFIKLCQAQKLNPFLGEAYLIKYSQNASAAFVVGKSTFTQRAEENPNFAGVSSGVIVQRGEEVLELPGSFHLRTDALLGGWCKVYRKDREVNIHKTVTIQEYNTSLNVWKSKPATMIEKVALVQGLREAFPTALAGLYDQAEGVNQSILGEADIQSMPEPEQKPHRPSWMTDEAQMAGVKDFVESQLKETWDAWVAFYRAEGWEAHDFPTAESMKDAARNWHEKRLQEAPEEPETAATEPVPAEVAGDTERFPGMEEEYLPPFS